MTRSSVPLSHSATAAEAAPVLRIEGLEVRLATPQGRSIVKDITLDVAPGETLCVVGESGSGKSVSSFAVMGLLDPDALRPVAGQILLQGEDLLQASPERLRALRATSMAMIFQEPMTALNPVETVGRQIEEVLQLHTRASAPERKARVLTMMAAVHLPEPERLYHSYPHQLSGGQRQRIVICMALILEPKLLIADEPTTALDVTTQRQILALIREMQQKMGTAVLFITHDMGVVAEIADRVVVMKEGRVVETGRTEQILANPARDYTRYLVSSVPSLIPRAGEPVPPAPVLEVIGLNKTYETRRLFRAPRVVHAAREVSFTLNRGEILGVVGESGSGKSSVARCVMRLQDPTSGQIRLGGADIGAMKGEALRQSRRRIQMVFQDPYRSLNPRVRVGESIIEGLMNFGSSHEAAMARARELMDRVDLPAEALSRYPHQFSGGQRQRIAIARALASKPDVLVADEAVSALDVSVQARILDLLGEIRRDTGVAILFITHDLRVAAQLCDSLIVMRKGEVVEAGAAAELLARPRHDYTRSLCEAAPGRHWDFRNFRPSGLSFG